MHPKMVEAKRLERRECPECGTLLIRAFIDGGAETVICPGKFCTFTTIVERTK